MFAVCFGGPSQLVSAARRNWFRRWLATGFGGPSQLVSAVARNWFRRWLATGFGAGRQLVSAGSRNCWQNGGFFRELETSCDSQRVATDAGPRDLNLAGLPGTHPVRLGPGLASAVAPKSLRRRLVAGMFAPVQVRDVVGINRPGVGHGLTRHPDHSLFEQLQFPIPDRPQRDAKPSVQFGLRHRHNARRLLDSFRALPD